MGLHQFPASMGSGITLICCPEVPPGGGLFYNTLPRPSAVSSGALAKEGTATQGQEETLPSAACWGGVCSSRWTEPPPCQECGWGRSGLSGLGEQGDLLLSEAGHLRAPHSRCQPAVRVSAGGGAPDLQGLRPHGIPSSGLLEIGLPCGDTWITDICLPGLREGTCRPS